MVLFSRKVAMSRAEKGGLGSGRLHTRLVALFSVIAAVPTVFVAIFASLLFQSGLEFWFSDRSRGMIENAVQIAKSSYDKEVQRVTEETVTMSGDLAAYLREVPLDLGLANAFADRRRRIAYERLLLDLIEGDPTLFVRRDEVEAQWAWIDQIRAGWAQTELAPRPYAAGTWGPSAAIALTERDGISWHE
jgi:glucose-6-phosphate 1-dehydrogenase